MDCTLLDFRRRALRRLAIDAGTVACVVASAGAVLGAASGGLSWGRVALAVLVGQAAAIVRVAGVLRTGALPWAFLRAYIDRPGTFALTAPSTGRHAAAALVEQMDLTHVATAVHDSGSPAAVFDLLQSTNRLVTAAVGRLSGSVSLVSALSDGRLVHTSGIRVLAGADVVAVHVPDDGPVDIASAHRTALVTLVGHGAQPVATGVEVFLEAHRREHRAYSVVGPLAARAFDLRSDGRVLRCTIAAPTAAVAAARPGGMVAGGATVRLAV